MNRLTGLWSLSVLVPPLPTQPLPVLPSGLREVGVDVSFEDPLGAETLPAPVHDTAERLAAAVQEHVPFQPAAGARGTVVHLKRKHMHYNTSVHKMSIYTSNALYNKTEILVA
ncbi:hypothetical protein TNCV_543011 [Trichonephila clavipes]|nr:hypothetical protein TNCV_543011 [Trichonephila clavipes]